MSETSVFVEGLVLPAQIGINADEIGRAQPLRLDIEVKLASAGAAASEAIADTVDYFRRSGTYSIERARTVLGYEPAVGLDDGMERTERWLRDAGLLG